LRAAIPHYHACGGKGKCSTCRILVHEGAANVSTYSSKEAALRRKINIPENIRLACQTYIIGPKVKVHRIIRDETDIGLYVDLDSKEDLYNTGEEKDLVLLFLDIRNFTAFVADYLAFDVIHVMRRLFSLFRSCIEKHEGRIIETAGDGFYAVFGFEQSLQDAASNACKAAFAIESELHHFNEDYLSKYFLHRFETGIGIHAGRVIVGNIGIGVNNNLTVMGLPVNIASRLQAATKEVNNSIIISADVYKRLEDKPQAAYQSILLKGIPNEVGIYTIGHAYTMPVQLVT
jgi:adenylate cyclase